MCGGAGRNSFAGARDVLSASRPYLRNACVHASSRIGRFEHFTCSRAADCRMKILHTTSTSYSKGRDHQLYCVTPPSLALASHLGTLSTLHLVAPMYLPQRLEKDSPEARDLVEIAQCLPAITMPINTPTNRAARPLTQHIKVRQPPIRSRNRHSSTSSQPATKRQTT